MNEDGRTTNITVSTKLDQLGIGAGNRSGEDKDGVAWKQQNEYEKMLARLNLSGDEGSTIPAETKSGVVKSLGFVSSTASTTESTITGDLKRDSKKAKKRKRSQLEIEHAGEPLSSSSSISSQNASTPTAVAPRRFALASIDLL